MAYSFINALLSIIITSSTIICMKFLGRMAKSLPGPKTGLQMPYSKNRDHFCCRQHSTVPIFYQIFAQFWPKYRNFIERFNQIWQLNNYEKNEKGAELRCESTLKKFLHHLHHRHWSKVMLGWSDPIFSVTSIRFSRWAVYRTTLRAHLKTTSKKCKQYRPPDYVLRLVGMEKNQFQYYGLERALSILPLPDW